MSSNRRSELLREHLPSDINQSGYDISNNLSQIDDLLTNKYDLDEIGFEKPRIEDIDNAKSVMVDFITSIHKTPNHESIIYINGMIFCSDEYFRLN